MNALHALLERKLATLDTTLAVVLPGGQRFGDARARVTLTLHTLASLAHIATGEVGRVAQDHVEGRLDFDGTVRDLMAVAARMSRVMATIGAQKGHPPRALRTKRQ